MEQSSRDLSRDSSFKGKANGGSVSSGGNKKSRGNASDMYIASMTGGGSVGSSDGGVSRPGTGPKNGPNSPSNNKHLHHKTTKFAGDSDDESVGRKGPVFKKSIVGDLFGTMSGGEVSLAGLMYRSRLIEKNEDHVSLEEKKEESLQYESRTSTQELMESESDDDNESKLLKTMNPKQQLALTIKNWSVFPENDDHLIKEGAVYALIALAHLDDSTIRRCCASSFYHLSNRENNRKELLAIGTTAGVITLAMQARNWRVAKLCALSLCNLSMEVNGEAIMAKEGAILALVVLLGIKGQSLLPICVQALYNMTCSIEHFKGIERIIKALLNMSSAGYDHSEFLVKALVNCARYSWLRLRIIEDGGINSIHALMPNLNNHENKAEIVFHILTALRSLSESSGCRTEMLQKGSVELLYHLLTDNPPTGSSSNNNAANIARTVPRSPKNHRHGNQTKESPISNACDEKCFLLIMKILHNFLQVPQAMSATAFELSVQITSIVINRTKFLATIQYCAACYHIFTKEKLRNVRSLAIQVAGAMTMLLRSEDSITQFFAISSSGNLFFENLIEDPIKLEQLVKFFVLNGPSITDPAAKQALALALAKLSQEPTYLDVMDRLNLLDQVLILLIALRETHKDSLLLQESCCIAICRIALRMNDKITSEEKIRIAGIFLDMLFTTDNHYVLTSTISGIRALGATGLCPHELLTHPDYDIKKAFEEGNKKNLLTQVATIVAKHNNHVELCRVGCAVLAVFSYDVTTHDILADKHILNVIFANINSDDAVTSELVANTMCNLTTHPVASQSMITMNVVEVLAKLSSSTSEIILELSAKCICNITCNVALHKSMLENHVLEILLMISLVRTVSSHTKCTCAKALLNLIRDENLDYLSSSGAVRIFASLCTVPYEPLQKVCSKGFHVLTLNELRRKELVKHRSVLQAYFQMTKSATQFPSTKIRIRLGMSLINLLSCPVTNKDVIQAGGLACLKMIAMMEFEELREVIARISLNLTVEEYHQSQISKEPIVPILILLLQRYETFSTFEIAIHSMSRLSQLKQFKLKLIHDHGFEALLNVVFQGKVANSRISQEICRTWTHLSYIYDQAEHLIASGHLALAIRALYESGLANVKDTQLLILVMIRNISEALHARKYILEQHIFKMVVKMICKDYDDITDIAKKITASTNPPIGSTGHDEDEEEEEEAVGVAEKPSIVYDDMSACTLQIETLHRIKSLGYAAAIQLVYNLCQVTQLHDQLVKSGVMELLCKICIPNDAPDIAEEEARNLQLQLEEEAKEKEIRAQQPAEKPIEDQFVPMMPSGGSRSSFVGSTVSMKKSQSSDDENPKRHLVPGAGSNANLTNNRTVQFDTNPGNAAKQPPPASFEPPLPPYHPSHRHRIYLSSHYVDLIAKSLHLLSQSHICHDSMVKGGVMTIFRSLIYANLTEQSRVEMSGALAQIAQTKSCREQLVNQGACELLIALSITSDSNTQAQSATALAYLSEITKVKKGVVASLLLLSLSLEEQNKVLANPDSLMANGYIDANQVMNAALIHSRRDHGHLNGQGATGHMNNHGGHGHDHHEPGSVVNTNMVVNQNLTSLLRDLMADKKKFDIYLDGLQRRNTDNLSHNNFVPKTPGNPVQGLGSIQSSSNATSSNNHFGSIQRSISTKKGSFEQVVNSAAAANGINVPPPLNRKGTYGSMTSNNMRSSFSVDMLDNSSVASTASYGSGGLYQLGGQPTLNPQSLKYTNLLISESHNMLLKDEEDQALLIRYESFLFMPPNTTDTYQPESGGLSKRLLADLPLPSIPQDRDLEPPNRHDELLKIPVNQDPLPKDIQTPKYLDHHRSTMTDQLAGIRLEDSLTNGSEGGDQLGELDGIPSGMNGSPTMGGSSRLSTIRKLGGKGKDAALLSKSLPLDSRSPLMRNDNKPLFRNGGQQGSTPNSRGGQLPKISRAKTASKEEELDL